MDPTVLAFRTTSFGVFFLPSVKFKCLWACFSTCSFIYPKWRVLIRWLHLSQPYRNWPALLSEQGSDQNGGVPPTRWTFSQRAHRFQESNIEALTAHDCTDKYSCKLSHMQLTLTGAEPFQFQEPAGVPHKSCWTPMKKLSSVLFFKAFLNTFTSILSYFSVFGSCLDRFFSWIW